MEDEEFNKNFDALCSLGGILFYTPLMHSLAECQNDEERQHTAAWRIPFSLLCALQNEQCLQDIKNVAEKYPELIPPIVEAAKGLRKDRLTRGWTDYETDTYKQVIMELENRI